jgi:hypothetical protein
MVLRVLLNLDPPKFAKGDQMKFVRDLKGSLTPGAYIVFPHPGG